MKILGNIIWIVFGGLLLSLEYIVAGILMCVTIIGIPFGVQAFKLGFLALCPFGHKAADAPASRMPVGCDEHNMDTGRRDMDSSDAPRVWHFVLCHYHRDTVRVAAFQIDDALVYSFRQGHSQLLAMQ